jgi:hypothetical protein
LPLPEIIVSLCFQGGCGACAGKSGSLLAIRHLAGRVHSHQQASEPQGGARQVVTIGIIFSARQFYRSFAHRAEKNGAGSPAAAKPNLPVPVETEEPKAGLAHLQRSQEIQDVLLLTLTETIEAGNHAVGFRA